MNPINMNSHILLLRKFVLSVFTITAFFVTVSTSQAQTNQTPGKVHILLVADTNAKDAQVFGLGLDGDNMKRLFETLFARAGMKHRYTLTLYKGANVSPRKVRQYYQSLKVGPSDALVFYYTGHGETHKGQGHVMTMSRGILSRNQLLADMVRHKPRLTVVLTDCCANYRGQGFFGLGGQKVNGFDPDIAGAGPDDNPRQPKETEKTPYGPKVVKRRPKRSPGIQPIPQVVNNAIVLVHLLFHHKGIVDINAAKIGKSASGNARLGGSYFTVGLMNTLVLPVERVDRDKDGTAEWSELFPLLDSATLTASQRGGFAQRPVAFRLGNPR